jgi:hypothetical protein
MTWKEVVNLLKIRIEEDLFTEFKRYEVYIPSFNKKAQYIYTDDLIIWYTPENWIKHKIIKDFELEKWLGEQIQIN